MSFLCFYITFEGRSFPRTVRPAGRRFSFSASPHSPFSQRAPKGPPNDPPKSGLRVSVCCFSSLHPMEQLFGRQRLLPKTCFFFHWNEFLCPKSVCLLLMVVSVVKSLTMIRVTLLRGPVDGPSGGCFFFPFLSSFSVCGPEKNEQERGPSRPVKPFASGTW